MFQTKDETRKTEELYVYIENELFTATNNFRAFVYTVTNFVLRSF